MTTNLHEIKEVLQQALLQGGKILRENFGDKHDYKVKENQSSIVTQTDLDAEKTIKDLIRKSFPKHNILAEEEGYENNNSEYTWVVDPLDGSSNYQAGLGWFGVLIATLQKQEVVLAGAYLPMTDELYLAQKGKGATRNGATIQVSTETTLENVLFAYGLDAAEEKKLVQDMKYIEQVVRSVRNLRSTNSAVDFCYVADGRLGGFINQTTKAWDVAASQLIIQEAGGVVTDICGDPLEYDFTNPGKNYTFVAANPSLHKQVMKFIDTQY